MGRFSNRGLGRWEDGEWVIPLRGGQMLYLTKNEDGWRWSTSDGNWSDDPDDVWGDAEAAYMDWRRQ